MLEVGVPDRAAVGEAVEAGAVKAEAGAEGGHPGHRHLRHRLLLLR